MTLNWRKTRLYAGLLACALVLLVYTYGSYEGLEIKHLLHTGPQLGAQMPARLKIGRRVWFEGPVSARTRPVKDRWAVACETVLHPAVAETEDGFQYETKGTDLWEVEDELTNTVWIQAGPGLEVRMNLSAPCSGEFSQTHRDPDSPRRRWQGIAIGDKVTVIGHLSELSPPEVTVEYYWAGDQSHAHAEIAADHFVDPYWLLLMVPCLLIALWPEKADGR